MYEKASLLRCGMSTSVCCNHVYPTSHMFVTRRGKPYNAKTLAAPTFETANASAAMAATMPPSDCHTFFAQLPGQRAVAKGRIGTKWFDVPYLGPPVAPQRRYAGQPMTKCRTSCSIP